MEIRVKVALDANCFIDATNPSSHAHAAMKCLLAAHEAHVLELTVSRQTVAELEPKADAALDLVNRFVVLPHFPIGLWNDQVAPWGQGAGTWNDAKQNQTIQQELQALAKAGSDIRDRGAYIDALRSGADAFVTSDTQLVGSAAAKRIEGRFGLRVLTPQQLIEKLRS